MCNISNVRGALLVVLCSALYLGDLPWSSTQVLRGEALLGAGDLTHAEEAFKLAIDCNLNIEYNIDERAITQQQREWTMRAQDGVTNITRYRSSRSDYTVLMTAGLHQDALQCSKYMLALAPCRVARLCTVKAMCALHAFDECKKFIDDFMGSTADTELQPRAHSSAAFPVVASTLVGWCVVNNSFVCDVPATVQYILCMGPELGALYVKFLKNIDMNRSPEHRSIIMAQLYLVLQNLCTKLSGELCNRLGFLDLYFDVIYLFCYYQHETLTTNGTGHRCKRKTLPYLWT